MCHFLFSVHQYYFIFSHSLFLFHLKLAHASHPFTYYRQRFDTHIQNVLVVLFWSRLATHSLANFCLYHCSWPYLLIASVSKWIVYLNVYLWQSIYTDMTNMLPLAHTHTHHTENEGYKWMVGLKYCLLCISMGHFSMYIYTIFECLSIYFKLKWILNENPKFDVDK